MAESSNDQFELIAANSVVTARHGDDVILPCLLSFKSNAVTVEIRWFKQDKCIYSMCKTLQVTEERGYEGRVSLMTQEQKLDVSLKLNKVCESDEGDYRCEVICDGQKKEATVHLRVTEELEAAALRTIRQQELQKKPQPLWRSKKEFEQNRDFLRKYEENRDFLRKYEENRDFLRKYEEERKSLRKIRQQELEALALRKIRQKERKPLRTREQELEAAALRRIRQQEPELSGETPDPTNPVRRRNSKDLDPPNMGEKSSSPDSSSTESLS